MNIGVELQWQGWRLWGLHTEIGSPFGVELGGTLRLHLYHNAFKTSEWLVVCLGARPVTVRSGPWMCGYVTPHSSPASTKKRRETAKTILIKKRFESCECLWVYEDITRIPYNAQTHPPPVLQRRISLCPPNASQKSRFQPQFIPWLLVNEICGHVYCFQEVLFPCHCDADKQP